MIEAIRKAILAGVGAAAITTEKAEKALNELVEKGKLSATEAREAANKIADEGRREFDEAARTLEGRIDEMFSRVGRGQRERIDALETRIIILEERLAQMEKTSAVDAAEK